MIIEDQCVYDMSFITRAEDIRKITKIRDTTVVLFPDTDDPEINSALMEIELDCVVSVVRVKPGVSVHTFNGNVVINGETVNNGEIVIANGNIEIMPLPDGMHLDVIVNGNCESDISNQEKITFLQVNGNFEIKDFSKCVKLSKGAYITADKFKEDGWCYETAGYAVVDQLPENAKGTVESPIIIAHESVAKSNVMLDGYVVYVPKIEKITFWDKTVNLTVTRDMLQNTDGKIVISNVVNLKIDNDVPPEMFREKILLIGKCVNLSVPRKLKSIVVLKCRKVVKTKVRLWG